ncbi:MAG: ribosome silencing factor [Planctomycetaceae bacterium]|nr:ribosome silencing factor [Planctomycetaceae bacterium]
MVVGGILFRVKFHLCKSFPTSFYPELVSQLSKFPDCRAPRFTLSRDSLLLHFKKIPSKQLLSEPPVNEPITDSESVRENTRGHDLAIAIAQVIEETRGKDIRVLDLRSVTEVFDYFVIATGSSRRQMHAVSDEIERIVKANWGDEKRGIEGYNESRWIVLDYGDVVVQLFDSDSRDYWDLEHLWGDAKRVEFTANE